MIRKNTRFRPVGAQDARDPKKKLADQTVVPPKGKGAKPVDEESQKAGERFVAKPGDFRKLKPGEKVSKNPHGAKKP
jgi:hypothetical protein